MKSQNVCKNLNHFSKKRQNLYAQQKEFECVALKKEIFHWKSENKKQIHENNKLKQRLERHPSELNSDFELIKSEKKWLEKHSNQLKLENESLRRRVFKL